MATLPLSPISCPPQTLQQKRGGAFVANQLVESLYASPDIGSLISASVVDGGTALVISSQSNTTPFNLNANVVNSSDSALGSLFVTEVYAHGEVVRYSPDADKVGLFIRDQVETDAINYTISDGNGGISVGTIEVELTGINHAPVMLSEQITIYQNSEASLNILANDIDFDGDTIELLSTSSSDLVSVNYTLNGDITIIPNDSGL